MHSSGLVNVGVWVCTLAVDSPPLLCLWGLEYRTPCCLLALTPVSESGGGGGAEGRGERK